MLKYTLKNHRLNSTKTTKINDVIFKLQRVLNIKKQS